MFMGNKTLRGENEKVLMTQEQIEEYVKCRNDIIYFAENYFYIQTLNEGRKIIPLWDFQKKLLKSFVEPPNNKRHVCLLSARQNSKSTTVSIYFAWRALFSKDETYAVLANKESTAQEILSRIQMAYEQFPLWLQRGVIEWNKKSFSLENNVKIICGTTSSSSIRGTTISCMLIDEHAFIPSNLYESFWNSILPTISSGTKSKIIVVSTPNGMNHFYNLYKDAVEGKNDFYPIKIAWNARPDRDEEWARKTKMNMTESAWRQEFGCIFAGSTNTLIDGDILENIKTKKPIGYKFNTSMKIYENPIEGKNYVLGCDSSKGTGSDYAVIQVLKLNSEKDIEQVAVYRDNNTSPEIFAKRCIDISEFYNNAQMMVESNDIGELVCDKLWNEYECDRLLNCDSKGLGIRSTRKTKLQGNMLLKEYIENGWLHVCDSDTVKEFSRYEEKTLNVFHAAGENDNDDLITSLLWGVFYIKTDFYDADSNGRSETKNKNDLNNSEEDHPIFLSSQDFNNYYQNDQNNSDPSNYSW